MCLADQLLLTLLYLRTYDTLLHIGFQFGVSESYAQKRYTFTKMLLLRCLDLPDEQALKEAILGGSCWCNRTSYWKTHWQAARLLQWQKKHHTIKVLLIVCLLTWLIQAIRFNKRQIHDFELYKNSKFDLSDELEVNADCGTPLAGFQGIQKVTY